MIVSERYGGGHRWYCTNCDKGHNGWLSTIQWTNSKPPEFCKRCNPLDIQLDICVPRKVFEIARTAIPNLSDLKLSLSGLPNPGTDLEYTVLLSRKDGRKPTKDHIEWSITTIKAIAYTVGALC